MQMKPVFIISFFAAAFSLQAPAQNAKQDSASLNRELTLEREYSPILKDASKINRLPEIKEPEAPKTKVEFSGYTIPLLVSPYLRTINPEVYLKGLDASKYKGYLNLGLSSLLDVDGDAGYQFLNANTDFLSLYASHRSSNGKVTYLQNDEKQTMKFNDDLLGANYKHNFEQALFVADAQYTYSGFNYYGINNPEYLINSTGEIIDPGVDKNKNQVNNLLRTHLGIASVNSDVVDYRANLTYTLFDQKYGYLKTIKGRTENRIMGDIDFHANFNSTIGIGLKGYAKTYIYRSPVDYIPDFYTAYQEPDRNYTALSASPYFTFEGDNWNMQIGFSANARMNFSANNQIHSIKDFLFAPDVRFNYKPSDIFLFYLSAGGGITDNSNYALYYENRYIAPFIRMRDTKSPLDGTLGFHLSFLQNLDMELFGGYQITKDEHFYINIPYFNDDVYSGEKIMGQLIVPQYAKNQTFKLGGSLKYVFQDIFDLGLNLTYYKRTIKDPAESVNFPSTEKIIPWNKPDFTSDLTVGFKVPSVPFRADLNYRLETGRKYFDSFDNAPAMKDIHDLSLKGTYSIDEMLSVYLVANNLLFQKYDIWYGYPAQNFNIMGGISVKF